MNKVFTFSLTLLLIVASCTSAPKDNLDLLNGYWEINQIENAHGSTKEYGLSQNIDFFELNKNGQGVRKKVQPDIQGNFTATNASENIDILIENNNVFLKYSTAFDTWQEEIVSLSQSELVLRNKDDYTYTYRRYQPLNLD